MYILRLYLDFRRLIVLDMGSHGNRGLFAKDVGSYDYFFLLATGLWPMVTSFRLLRSERQESQVRLDPGINTSSNP